jgi:hypothetical protein
MIGVFAAAASKDPAAASKRRRLTPSQSHTGSGALSPAATPIAHGIGLDRQGLIGFRKNPSHRGVAAEIRCTGRARVIGQQFRPL